eukprot:7626952-Heterocapsa_arctica.AAC.1
MSVLVRLKIVISSSGFAQNYKPVVRNLMKIAICCICDERRNTAVSAVGVGPCPQKPSYRGRAGAGGPQLANPGAWRAAAVRASPAQDKRRRLHRARDPV